MQMVHPLGERYQRLALTNPPCRISVLTHLPGWRWSIKSRHETHNENMNIRATCQSTVARGVSGLIADGSTCLLFAAESIRGERLTGSPPYVGARNTDLYMLRALNVLPAYSRANSMGLVHACFLGRASLEKPKRMPSPQIRNGWRLSCLPSACFHWILPQVLKGMVQNTLSQQAKGCHKSQIDITLLTLKRLGLDNRQQAICSKERHHF